MQNRLAYIRPSAASVWVKCSAAPREVASRTAQLSNPNAFSAAGDPAREGQLGHRAIEILLSGGELTESVVRGLCLEFGVSPDEAQWLVNFGKRAIKKMPFRSADASMSPESWRYLLEEPVKAELLPDLPAITGTADYLACRRVERISGEPDKYELGIIDWKFGRVEVPPPDRNFQIWCYAVMAAESFELGEVVKVTAQIRYPRLGINSRLVEFDAESLAVMRESLATALAKCYAPNPEYRTGSHCENCNAQSTCPAVNKALAMFGEKLEATGGMPVKPVRDMTQAEVGKVLGLKRLVTRWASVIEGQIKRYVDEHGPIKLGDGRVYDKKTTTRRAIDLSTPGAWDVLEPMCGSKALLENVKISQTAVKNAAAEKYLADHGKQKFGRGERMKLESELMRALTENEAITETETVRYAFGRDESE